MAPSSSGLGLRIFTPATGVRVPVGSVVLFPSCRKVSMVRKILLPLFAVFALFLAASKPVEAALPVEGAWVAIWNSPEPDEYSVGVIQNGKLIIYSVNPWTGEVTKIWRNTDVSYLNRVRWSYLLFVLPDPAEAL